MTKVFTRLLRDDGEITELPESAVVWPGLITLRGCVAVARRAYVNAPGEPIAVELVERPRPRFGRYRKGDR